MIEGCRFCGIPRLMAKGTLCREDEKRFGLKVHPLTNALAQHDWRYIDSEIWKRRIREKIKPIEGGGE